MALNDVALVSRALIRIGAAPITSFDDGTAESEISGALFAPVRDALLSSYPWSFATGQVELTQLETDPIADFDYAFQLPNDFLRAISAGASSKGRGLVYRLHHTFERVAGVPGHSLRVHLVTGDRVGEDVDALIGVDVVARDPLGRTELDHVGRHRVGARELEAKPLGSQPVGVQPHGAPRLAETRRDPVSDSLHFGLGEVCFGRGPGKEPVPGDPRRSNSRCRRVSITVRCRGGAPQRARTTVGVVSAPEGG